MHNPIRLPDGRVRIGGVQYGLAAELSNEDDATWTLLQLLDGTRTVEEVVAEFAASGVDPASVRETLNALVEAGHIEDAAAEPPPGLTEEDLERYERGANLYSWIDLTPRRSPWDVQLRLKNSSVTVLGLGGAGSAAATALVSSGIGSIRCVDFDVVERSNLNRQFLYTEADIGRRKVATAVERLRALNPSVEVVGEEAWVEGKDDLARLMDGQDLLLLCADRPDPRALLLRASDASTETRTPWISCFYNGPMAVVGTFVPFQVPCYRCLRHWAEETGRDADAGELLRTVDENAVIAPTAGITGNLAAYEAINVLGNIRPQTVGRLFHLNLLAYDHFYFVEPPFWDDCPACGSHVRQGSSAGAERA